MENLFREVYVTFLGISVLFAMAEQKNKDVLKLPTVLESRTEKEIRRQDSAGEYLTDKRANKTNLLPYLHENRARQKSITISVN